MSSIGGQGGSVHNNYSLIQVDGAAPGSNDVPTGPEQKKALAGLEPANKPSTLERTHGTWAHNSLATRSLVTPPSPTSYRKLTPTLLA